MTLIDLMQAKCVEASLEYERQRMKALLCEVRDIERRLGRLSGMSDIRRSIGNIVDSMEMEESVLDSMWRCLEYSIHTYVKHEENITDFAEEKARDGNEWNKLEIADIDIYKKIPESFTKIFY